jgi:two-component system copper resistance phosphate regulon response regulator CusR
MKILVVEDDGKLARLLCQGLEEEGHQVDVAADGERGLELALTGNHDAIVLDILLPRRDGFEVCRHLRERGLDTPILMLTARDAVPDRVTGLDSGADDYLTKPFSFDELIARLQAITRDAASRQPAPELMLGPLRIDPRSHRAWLGQEPLELTVTEYRLLEYLVRHCGRIVSRDELLARLWERTGGSGTRVVDIYLGYLRRKLAPAASRLALRVVRGRGIVLEGTPGGGRAS